MAVSPMARFFKQALTRRTKTLNTRAPDGAVIANDTRQPAPFICQPSLFEKKLAAGWNPDGFPRPLQEDLSAYY